jgi:23S rRNA pseudouridine1911/1915/1917 synthase
LKITVNNSSTLLEFLIGHYPDSPKTRIKKLLQTGSVFVNNKQVTLHSLPLKPGDTVEINREAGKAAKAGLPFPVLYEDKDIIVIDKPPGRPTSSTDGSLSIQDILTGYLKEQSRGKTRAFVVHRLDKEVSGVLLFAKCDEAMETLKERWKETEKHYFALVEGIPEKSEDTIRSLLAEDKSQRMYSTKDAKNGKLAVTSYKILKLLQGQALLDIRTETGRKNQIRVHLSEAGFPIVGDRKYGASDKFKRRIRLHACSLSFPHPSDGRIITVISSMPEGFLTLKMKDEHYK